jgi:hypothetical protein
MPRVDGGTVAAFDAADATAGLPIAWVVALRPPRIDAARVRAEQLKRDGARAFALGPLDDDAVVQVATDLVAPPDESILQQLAEAGGSPFLVVETLLGLRRRRGYASSAARS